MTTTKLLQAAAFALIVTPALGAEPVSRERSWTESFAVSATSPDIRVNNVWGNVTVVAGPPGQVVLSAHELRSAPTQALFELSLELIPLDIQADDHGVSLTVGDNTPQNWRRFDRCRNCRVDYHFELTVPAASSVDVATVTDGRVKVSGVIGQVTASNVNGPVEVNGAKECGVLESVNGRMSVTFATAPTHDCALETINGDIEVELPDSAGLDVALNLFNGRVHSEVDVEPLALPAQIEQSEENGRYRYRIAQPAGLRLRGGGPLFSFSSMNGDIRIRTNP